MSVTLEPPTHHAIGIHKNVSFLDYARIDALNWHTLAPYRKSAKEGHFRELVPEEDTESLDFGAAFHTAVLEPERFAADYAVMPAWQHTAQSNIGKAERAEWREANKTKAHLTSVEHDDLMGMQASVRNHTLAAAVLLGQGTNELTTVWTDKETGQKCKGRIDRLARVPIGLLDPTAPNADQTAIVISDVKTTRSIVPRKFTNDLVDYGYHGQFAFYVDGLLAHRPMDVAFYCVAIEKKPPYDLIVFQIRDDVLEEGRKLYRRLMTRKQQCDEAKKWPGMSDRAVPLFLPDYAMEGSGDE